jgi:hypothetical protein
MVDLATPIASKQIVNSDFTKQRSIKASALSLLLYAQSESETLPISSWLKRKNGWNPKSVAYSTKTRLSEQIATRIVIVVLRIRESPQSVGIRAGRYNRGRGVAGRK